jgi:hypothetical protein
VKQAATILLLSLLAFNWVGYRLLSSYLEHSSDLALEKKIEKEDFDDASLLELRVPLNAPYLGETFTDFERIDGEIVVDGIHYKYVKRKVENGELVLLCIPNTGKTKILNSRVDFFKMVNDVNQSSESKSKNTSSHKSFTTEYRFENNTWALACVSSIAKMEFSIISSTITDGYNAVPDQPPRA